MPNIPGRLKYLFCSENPLPSELLEDETTEELFYYDVLGDNHREKIKKWKKYLKE